MEAGELSQALSQGRGHEKAILGKNIPTKYTSLMTIYLITTYKLTDKLLVFYLSLLCVSTEDSQPQTWADSVPGTVSRHEIHVWYWVASVYVWLDELDIPGSIVWHQGLLASIQNIKFILKTSMAACVPCTRGRILCLPWLPNYHGCPGVHQWAGAKPGWEPPCEQNSRGPCSSPPPLTPPPRHCSPTVFM